MYKLIQIALIIIGLIFSGFNATSFANQTEDKLATAQKKLEEATREYAELASELGGDRANHFIRSFSFSDDGASLNKARLGINIGEVEISENGEKSTNSSNKEIDGVEVLGVSPDSPAEKVGLKSGDVITALNGKVLKSNDQHSAIEQLTDIMSEFTPGDLVDVLFQRDGVTKSVSVITDKMPKSNFKMLLGDNSFNFDTEIDLSGLEGLSELKELKGLEALGDIDIQVFGNKGDGDFPGRFMFFNNGPLGDAELVELSPELGDYFGAKSGILVVKAPSDSEIDLRDGDVIRNIDGREPSSVNHAMRIMRSYEVGELVNLEILRKKRKRTLSITIPEKKSQNSNIFEWHKEKSSSENKPMKLQKKIKIVKAQETT